MNITALQEQLHPLAKRLVRFRVLLCVLVVVIAYGFIIWRIDTLSNAQPDQSAVASQATSSAPHIDQATVNKVKQLQDNSVNVQVLFSQTRQNPFHE